MPSRVLSESWQGSKVGFGGGHGYCRTQLFHLRAFDTWTKNDALLVDPDELMVDVVDCDVVKVDWYVDDQLVAADFGERFRPKSHRVGSGLHTIQARAHDDTEWVRAPRDLLQQTVSWQVDLH